MFFTLAKALAKKGHEVYVIKHKIDFGTKEKLPQNLKVFEVEPTLTYSGGLPSTLKQNLIYFKNAISLGLKVIRKNNIDLIHANNYTPSLVGSILSSITSRKLIVTIHDVASTNGLEFWHKWMDQFSSKGIFNHFIGYIGEILTIKLPRGTIHTVSWQSKEDILSIRKNASICVIPNGLEIDNSFELEQQTQFKTNILYIGRAVFYKNLEVVIKAFKIINQICPDAKLYVVGDGPMSSAWRQLAINEGLTKNVIFLGFISQNQKISLLNSTSALVLPSIWEGFGLVILEAWAMGKPVIVAKIRPLSDIVVEGIDGYQASSYDSKDWAKKILMVLLNQEIAKELGKNGKKKVIEQYNLEKNIKAIETMYNQVNLSYQNNRRVG